MRLAQVITLFLPDFVGGATLACARVAQGLRARGHEVEVFCGRPHGDAAPYAESSWDVDGLTVTGVNAAPGYDALATRSYRHPEVGPAFERFLDRFRPDVVHFHSIQALGAELLATTAARRIPIVVTLHDWWWWCARMFLVDQHGFVCPPRVTSERCHCAPTVDFVERRRHLAALLAHADCVLTPSRFLADAAIANGVPPTRIGVCPNGIDRLPVADARRPGPLRFGYFGGPDHRSKGLPTLIAAADALDCGGFELRLHVDGRSARRLVDRVGFTIAVPRTIADRVRVLPPFAPAALGTALGELDCLVVPSLMRESYSLVTREALAAGVPVIASDSGGPSEVIVPGRNGLLFATGDAADLAACLRHFVLEPGLAEALREGARATPVPSLDAQLRQLEDVYAALQPAVGPSPATLPPAAIPGPAPTAVPELGPVLFVAGCDGAPYRYRVGTLRDALATRGIASRAVWWSDPELPNAIAAADTVIVYRVPMSPWLGACLDYANGLGRCLVFSCDDLLFDVTATPHDALAVLPAGQREWWVAATARYAATLRACDVFLGATEPLVAAAARLGVGGFVVRNGLGERALATVEALRKNRAPREQDSVALAYFSGTTMHDLDFAAIAPALARVLAARPAVRLRLGGHLRTSPALEPWRDRIERLPFLPWPNLLAELARADVQLAPLRLGDPFSDAKSEVKYLEAGALGVPTVASPTDAFCRAIVSGRNGMLAADAAEWERVLLALIDDPGWRVRLGNAAHQDVFLHATPAARAESLVNGLRAARAGSRAARDRLRAERAPIPRPDPVASPVAPDPTHHQEVGAHDLEPANLELGAAVEARDTPSGFLLAGRSVGQRFRATADGLVRIDVRVGTDGRGGRRRLVVHLADAPGGADLRRVTLEVAPADGAWIAASFAPLDASGRELYVWIESEGATESDAVTLWTYVHGHGDAPPGGLHLDHRAAPGSLTFRTFYGVG